jgi:NAD(P)-dependent dehydrogenase (short-subunit alcohol dehydrogenase family)
VRRDGGGDLVGPCVVERTDAEDQAVPHGTVDEVQGQGGVAACDLVETGWWDELPDDARQEAFTAFAQRALVRRNGRPQDVAHAIVALIENGFITGVVLPCDGGLRLT